MFYGYARVSTQGQNDTSISVQLKFLENQAKSLGLPFTPMHEKASGKNVAGRAVFMHLLKIMKEGDILGVYDNSRLGRNTEDNLGIVSGLYSRGIQVSISGKIVDPNNPQDELLFSIESSISTFQRKVQLAKSRAGIDTKKANGDWIMRGDLYGWDLIRTRGKTTATINPTAAKLINYVFEEYAKGKSFVDIEKYMMANYDPKIYGFTFNASAIRRMLMKPIYMGYYTLDTGDCFDIVKMDRATLESKLVKSNIYPPIVSEELWWKVFDSWRKIRRVRTRQYEYRWSAYELSGVLRCGKCGKGLTHCYNKTKSLNPEVEDTNSYTCNLHKEGCDGTVRRFKAYDMENLIKMCFLTTFLSGIEVSSFFAEKKNELLEGTKDVRANIDFYKKDLAENSKKRSRLVELIEAGLSDVKEVKDRIEALNNEKKEIEAKIDELESSILYQNQEIEDILEEESQNAIDDMIGGDSTHRRDLFLKYIKRADVFEDYMEVEFMNSKKFVIQNYPKFQRDLESQKFDMYYKGKLQASGEMDGVDGTMRFIFPMTDDKFIRASNNYYRKIATKVSVTMADCFTKP